MTRPRVLLIHRSYRTKGGEDHFLESVLAPALYKLNVTSESLIFPPLKLRSWSGVLEFVGMVMGWERLRPSYRVIGRKVRDFGATHVIFNNMIPTLSLKGPSVAHASGARTFLWTHNARLFCANGLVFNGREKCQRCLTKGSYWAFLQKCHPSRMQSLIYAWIYRRRRVTRLLNESIDEFVSVSEFTASGVRMALEGVFAPNVETKVVTVRNPPPSSASLDQPLADSVAELVLKIRAIPQPFFAFVGRISSEKGADLFVELAKRFPDSGFVLCGEGPLLPTLRLSPNLVYAGVIGEQAKAWIYQNASALIVCSRVPENAPLVIAESQPYATPVVYPKGGGAEESVTYFGRSGCLLEDFKAQTFERKARSIASSDFDQKLKKLLNR